MIANIVVVSLENYFLLYLVLSFFVIVNYYGLVDRAQYLMRFQTELKLFKRTIIYWIFIALNPLNWLLVAIMFIVRLLLTPIGGDKR